MIRPISTGLINISVKSPKKILLSKSLSLKKFVPGSIFLLLRSWLLISKSKHGIIRYIYHTKARTNYMKAPMSLWHHPVDCSANIQCYTL
jgi:hypothetical protein